MADQTESSTVVRAPRAVVLAVIADLIAYPEWSNGVKSVNVLTATPAGLPETATFVIDAGPIRDKYTLAYTWAADGSRVDWELVEGDVTKELTGSYALADLPDGVNVTYRLRVDVRIPMIGLVKRRAEKVIIDSALRGLKERSEGSAQK
jgi:ribosome-associated toxin RatA of RatAB toxin-antitoxin module